MEGRSRFCKLGLTKATMPGSEAISHYPAFPPGFWRRLVLYPAEGWIGGAIEDDMHQFHLRIDHANGRIASAKGSALRHPWTGCAGAPLHLAAELAGELLTQVAGRDPRQHCTHLFDLAIVMAAHAEDTGPSRFDMRVADRVEGRTTATLERNGIACLRWQITDTTIDGPESFAGRDMKQLSAWKSDYPAEQAEYATMLRRAIFVSGARRYELVKNRRGLQSPLARHAVCFNYQSPQIEKTVSLYEKRDFSHGDQEPLEDFQPERAFAALA